jgi:two-component system sensor histidine kinase YesM
MSTVVTDTLLRNASYNLNQLVLQVADNLSNDIKRASLAASTLSNDNVINDLVNEWAYEQAINLKFKISKQIDRNLNYLFNYNNEVVSVAFFLKDGRTYTYKNTLSVRQEIIRNMDWYSDIQKHPNKVFIPELSPSFLNTKNDKNTISVAVTPQKLSEKNKIEVIYVVFKSHIPDIYYAKEPFKSKGNLFIVNEDNVILMARDKTMISEKVDTNTNMLVTTAAVEKVQWKVVSLVDHSYITEDVKIINTYLNFMFLILILLFVSFSIFYFKDILNPIRKLTEKMGEVEKGDFTATIVLHANKEINNLGKAFNRMVYEINNLINEKDKKERERNKAEIEVLQSQINPHFLSNTLNAIRFMAMIAKADNIGHMTESLIKLLNASFGKKGKYIQIKDELENLKSYIDIMKIRYADKFDVIFEVDEQLEEFYILRLLLQPIIENAVLHGVCNSEEKGSISVTGYLCNQNVIFEIKDIGVGMSSEQISRVLSENCKNEKGFTSMGVGNVNKRIQLNHGKIYGITIESELDAYTKVSLRLPILLNDREDEVCIE